MRLVKIHSFLLLMFLVTVLACKHKADKEKTPGAIIYKGRFSLGPDLRTFKACGATNEYWVAANPDLELKYWEMVLHETPESPIYIEVEGVIAKSNPGDDGGHGDDKGFDSTLVVKKTIKITKDIPADCK
jgi:copper homeostasis protein (lipoprotein)